jgi:uroporphyrinogen-III synthase
MIKNGDKKRILITQPRPDTDKSPYFELAKKYDVELEFHPFIRLEPISSKEFRKQKVDVPQFTAVIFTSRNAIDHFFRICEEMKISISQDTKYFCITEAVALYPRSLSYTVRGKFFMAPMV